MPSASSQQRTTYSQAQRVLAIYVALANARRGLTVGELVERTQVTRRTINRDLLVLQHDHLVRVHDVDERGRKRWVLLPTGPSAGATFTQGELLALCLGRSMLSFARGSELYASMQAAFAKVADRLGARDVAELDLDRKLFAVPDAPPVNIDTEAFDDCVNELLTAVLRGTQLRIAYDSRHDGQRANLLVDPLTLAYYKARLYLIATVRGDGAKTADMRAIRLFAVHRIVTAEWLRGTHIDVPDGYRPAALFSDRFGIFKGGEPTNVRVHFGASAAGYARERLWHTSQRCMDLANGACEMSWTIPVTPELVSWLLSFGAGARVLEPPELRAKMADTLRAAAGQYAGSAAPC